MIPNYNSKEIEIVKLNDRSEYFCIISSVQPSLNNTGGHVVLHRHFVERPYLNFVQCNLKLKRPFFIERLLKTRLRPYLLAFMPFYDRFDIAPLKKISKPEFVLTVAHDRMCFAALKAAKFWRVPLVTIFHDWYPASSGAHPSWQYFLDREFIHLYRCSDLALCVSNQMKVALGVHENSIVLPPIPSSIKQFQVGSIRTNPNLFYSGFCGGVYAKMLNGLISNSKYHPFSLTITGSISNEVFLEEAGKVKILGLLTEENYGIALKQADIVIVLLNFDLNKKRHFSTHFPSKLIEYCGKGKLIGIWGPSYSTAIQWAKETGAAFYYETDNVNEFISELLKVYANNEKREGLISNASRMYEQEYAPEIIDSKLKIAINHLLLK